ncbi:hypothetical protein [Actinomadura decatromicini]|uniref:Lipoprotein n=1 Tax=Actinomadura decatromicini TaxID=2604572 RepID=A0A5D3FPB2_9ACTN|nr:hypothetical protein [Actinomadura decatromicini]TYK49015.1 hypothetical protein FXF68_14350 [Actinomadura decatromicini]
MPAFACAAFAACAALTSCGGSETASAPSSPPPSSPAPASSPSPAASPVDRSPSAEKLVLRWRRTGGFAGVGGPGSVPEFSLYSTGRAVVASGAASGGQPPGKLTEYRLKPEAVRRLLDGARAAGLGRSHTVGSDRIADAMITVVTMDGATTRIIQAESQSGPEARFLKRLDPAGWPASDQAAKPKPYEPAKTAVLAGETSGAGTVKAWPLAPLGGGVREAGAVCTLAPARKVPATGPDVAWRSEGRTYSVRLRPLLPAEASCRDIA